MSHDSSLGSIREIVSATLSCALQVAIVDAINAADVDRNRLRLRALERGTFTARKWTPDMEVKGIIMACHVVAVLRRRCTKIAREQRYAIARALCETAQAS